MQKSSRTFNVPNQTLKDFLLQKKFVYEGVEMMQHPTATNKNIWRTNVVYNEDGETIQGGSLLFLSTRAIHYEYHSFALILNHKNHQNIAAQLEVLPLEERGHVEEGLTCYGPHYVALNVTCEARETSQGWNWFNWLNDFSSRTNLEIFGNHIPPFNGELDL